MKKIILIALAISVVIGLYSCGIEDMLEQELSKLEAALESSDRTEETSETLSSEELTEDTDDSAETPEASIEDMDDSAETVSSEEPETSDSSEASESFELSETPELSETEESPEDESTTTTPEIELPPVDQIVPDVSTPETEEPIEDIEATEIEIDKSKPEGFYYGYGIYKQTDGSSFIYYAQTDSAYASHPYAGSDMGNAGCGPSCMAMVITNFTDTVVTPDTLGDWCTARGFAVNGRGTAYAMFPEACKKYGIELSYLNCGEKEEIEQALRSGKLIMCIVGKGDFAGNRHFLLIRGITNDGKLLVANSYKGSDGLVEWDYSRVFGQMNEATLWVFSR